MELEFTDEPAPVKIESVFAKCDRTDIKRPITTLSVSASDAETGLE